MPNEYRFEVALSFAGENRKLVREVAHLLQQSLGVDKVFYDEWFEAELAGADAQIVLQQIYGKQARLIVPCVSQPYNVKPWTQDEWRAIQALERTLRDAGGENIKRLRILPLRFGDGEVDGIFSTAIIPDVRDRSSQAITELILKRLALIHQEPGQTVSFVPLQDSLNQSIDLENLASDQLHLNTPAPLASIQAIEKNLEEDIRDAILEAMKQEDEKVINLIQKHMKYEDIERIASGSLGNIYEAEDPDVNRRRVALKIFPQKNLETQKKFEFEEAIEKAFERALEISDEPYFITIYDSCFNRDEQFYCYAMQFVDGPSLRQQLLKGPFDIYIARTIFLKIGTALVHSWSLGSSAGNIQPSNIVLRRVKDRDDFEPFISPFNLPRILNADATLKCLKSRSDVLDRELEGLNARKPNLEPEAFEAKLQDLIDQELEYLESIAYLVPEFFNWDHQYELTRQSDVYILGLLMYELLTGEMPPVLTGFEKIKEIFTDLVPLGLRPQKLKDIRIQALEDLTLNRHKAFKELPRITEKNPSSKCPEVYETIIKRMTSHEIDSSSAPESYRYEKIREVLELFLYYWNISLSLVKDSFARCTKDVELEENFFRSFYQSLTGKSGCPHAEFARKKFDARKFDPDLENKNWKQQYKLFRQAVLLLFSYYEHPEEAEKLNVLTHIAETHKGRKISENALYEHFKDCLIETVLEFDNKCDDDNRERIRKAWNDVLKGGIDYMKRNTKLDPD